MLAMETQITIEEKDVGKRLDVFLAERDGSISRSAVQKVIKRNLVQLNGRPAKSPHEALRIGDLITFSDDALAASDAPFVLLPRPDISLEIVYEDDDLIVVNKPSGLLVHATVRNEQDTLANALLAHYPPIRDIGEGPERPGIMHRLDKDASGLMVVAKTDLAYQSLKKSFQTHDVEKEYAVLTVGNPPNEEGTIDLPIGRSTSERRMAARSQPLEGDRPAVTHYSVEEYLPGAALLAVHTETGRTHQIRTHLKAIGCPVAGDKLYGPSKSPLPVGRLFLHARRLAIRHPKDGRRLEFSVPLPQELETFLTVLRKRGETSERLTNRTASVSPDEDTG
ncbi:RluA family pseudouridine synthase [Candidatus Uhrbacteria bacterium CG_4_10_14_0_8_um_filter_58_22]|uniref:Pseudouridine synthase n=1 Tax=Candidatus Uhrbacteria bacterium CG_4_10_14_0_8_um_filter_58_22 TaxID=1975029 RepID=A0A2M7QB27_9BACT|nr:MAG: RluA family pseudouridine synthase [Candidatus Uhrbacteria bacterium CG_4_10_14_0_8_um_filter_58_22]